MTTGSVFCPTCGTRSEVGPKFCATCGGSLPAAAAAAVPEVAPAPPVAAAPPAWGAPPAGSAPYQAPPPAPPAWGAPPTQQAWGPPPGAPGAAPARGGISPLLLLVGAVIIVAIIAAAIFVVTNNSKNSGGSIIFSPTTVGCPGQPFTTTVRLPSSVKGTDQITLQLDGKPVMTQSVTDFGMTQQSDSTWSETSTSQSDCSMGAGAHTETLLDAGGHVLAQGTFTLVASASTSANPVATPTPKAVATPTPKAVPTKTPTPVSGSTITIKPASFSCSGASVAVEMTIRLDASVDGSTQYSIQLDGVELTTGTVSAEFVQQSDGSWLSAGPIQSYALCSAVGTGQHTMSILDGDGNTLAEASFTATQ